MSKLPSEVCSLVAIVGPDAYTTTAYSTGSTLGRVDISKFESLMVVGAVAEWSTAGTFNMKLMECATSHGTYTSITGKAITVMGEVATSANHQAIINLDAAEMTAGYKWVGVESAIVAGCNACVMAFGFGNRYSDAVISTAYGDLSTVVEIIT